MAVKQSGTPVVSCNYDALGRRSYRTAGGLTTRYVYNGHQILAEYDGSDTLLRKFIYGPGIDEPIAMIVASGANAGMYFYHFDALGSVIALSQFNTALGYAQVVERYAYSAFGWTTVCDGSGTPRAGNVSLFGNPYMFTGRELESLDAGNRQLYDYRARFLQTDPIGYADGLNMYAYVSNNPLGFVDPMGLCKKKNNIQAMNLDVLYGMAKPGLGTLFTMLSNILSTSESLPSILGGYAISGATEMYAAVSTAQTMMPVFVTSHNPPRNQQKYDGKLIVPPVEYSPKQAQVIGSQNEVEFIKSLFELSNEKPQTQKTQPPVVHDPRIPVISGGKIIKEYYNGVEIVPGSNPPIAK